MIPDPAPDYDLDLNSHRCWYLAIAAMRRRYLAEHPEEATEADRE